MAHISIESVNMICSQNNSIAKRFLSVYIKCYQENNDIIFSTVLVLLYLFQDDSFASSGNELGSSRLEDLLGCSLMDSFFGELGCSLLNASTDSLAAENPSFSSHHIRFSTRSK